MKLLDKTNVLEKIDALAEKSKAVEKIAGFLAGAYLLITFLITSLRCRIVGHKYRAVTRGKFSGYKTCRCGKIVKMTKQENQSLKMEKKNE